MKKVKCQINEAFRNKAEIEEAANINLPSSIVSTLKDEANTTDTLSEGTYTGHITKLTQPDNASYFYIHIKLEGSDRVFRGRIFTTSANQQIREFYHFFATDNGIDFGAAIGAYVHFVIKQNNSGAYSFSNISNFAIAEAVSTRTRKTKSSTPQPEENIADLLDEDDD